MKTCKSKMLLCMQQTNKKTNKNNKTMKRNAIGLTLHMKETRLCVISHAESPAKHSKK